MQSKCVTSCGGFAYRAITQLPCGKLWSWVGEQLGKAFSSNNSGDGPESGDTSCHGKMHHTLYIPLHFLGWYPVRNSSAWHKVYAHKVSLMRDRGETFGVRQAPEALYVRRYDNRGECDSLEWGHIPTFWTHLDTAKHFIPFVCLPGQGTFPEKCGALRVYQDGAGLIVP